MNLSYVWYDTAHWLLSPARAASDLTKHFFDNPDNPLTHTPYGRTVSAACELFERTTRRYAKPDFGFETTLIGNEEVAVTERIVWERPFCRVISFERDHASAADQPKLLIVAPMSGHYATLLRGTVGGLPAHAPGHDHRLGRCQHGAPGRGPLRPRRLYRLPQGHVPGSRPGPARDGRLPAGGARDRGDRPPGGRERPLHPALHDPHGRPHRHPPLPHRREPAGRGARHRVVPSSTASPRCPRPIRASGAMSIRASCSSPASWP